MRLVIVLALLAAAHATPLGPAVAGERHHGRDVPTDRAFSGPGHRFRQPWEDRNGHGRHRHGPSTVIVVSPSRCWQAGHWSYQWVPQAYSYNTWVAGHWSPDGRWIDGHYAPAWYSGGYYQPLWVEGHWSHC